MKLTINSEKLEFESGFINFKTYNTYKSFIIYIKTPSTISKYELFSSPIRTYLILFGKTIIDVYADTNMSKKDSRLYEFKNNICWDHSDKISRDKMRISKLRKLGDYKRKLNDYDFF
jgi:hypothetical protein